MCGIAGLVDLRGRLGPERMGAIAKAMADTMVHRGPDDGGVWVDPSGYCALAHRRLSIIDTSSGGHQPMSTADGRTTICFNGEIYSYLDLKEKLERRGYGFRTRSDTEVLLYGMREYGTALLPQMDAMFAFALFGQDDRSLLIARDGFGEKPLYYYRKDGLFAFASELHALAVLPDFDDTVDAEDIAGYLSFQYVPAPRTIYRRARKLPPGCYLRLTPEGEITICRYFEFQTGYGDGPKRSVDDLADELEEILVRSISRKLISDVPLGAFLSGGVDSSVVVALAVKKLNRSLVTFSIGFSDAPESEHIAARQMAEHLGTDHQDRIISPDMLELGNRVGRLLDEPNGDSSCLPTYLLCEFARERVTVALSGDGGDEMFGGYGRYFATVDEGERKAAGDPDLSGWMPGEAYYHWRVLCYPDSELRSLMGDLPPELASLLTSLRQSINLTGKPVINRLRELDAAHYMPGAVLPKVDRMSMQHSLEVRAPLLGPEIARFAARLNPEDCYRGQSQGKLVLKQLAARYIPLEWLQRPKMGFGLPMSLWGREHLLYHARAITMGEGARLTEWIRPDALAAFLERQEANFGAYQLWALLILENWLRAHPASAGRA